MPLWLGEEIQAVLRRGDGELSALWPPLLGTLNLEAKNVRHDDHKLTSMCSILVLLPYQLHEDGQGYALPENRGGSKHPLYHKCCELDRNSG